MENIKGTDISFMKLVGLISIVIPLFSLAFSAYQYTKVESAYIKQKSFENYHFLISNFRGGSSQVAAATIYELKHYPEYCEISLKILASYEETWTDKLALETISLVKPELEKSCR